MQKRRNIILAFSLGTLILCSMGLAFFMAHESKPEINRAYFQVPDTEKIDEVTLHSRKGNIVLKFENSRWRVNETWDADGQMIKVLFATLRQVEPRRPVASAMRDSVAQTLVKNGIQVIIKEAGEQRLVFHAGGNGTKTETWFLKEGEDVPFVMTIPGYRVYAAGIFELDVNGWRDKRIFNFNWRNFRNLMVTYPSESKSNFEVAMQDSYFGIKGVPQADTTRLNNFLDAVSLLFADRFVSPGQRATDSLAALQPMVRLVISDVANRTYSLDLLPPGKGSDEIYGRLPEGELVVFNRNKMMEIVKRRDYFLKAR